MIFIKTYKNKLLLLLLFFRVFFCLFFFLFFFFCFVFLFLFFFLWWGRYQDCVMSALLIEQMSSEDIVNS